MKAVKYYFNYYKLLYLIIYFTNTNKTMSFIREYHFFITLSWIFEAIFQNITPEKGISFIFQESEGHVAIERFWGEAPSKVGLPADMCNCRKFLSEAKSLIK